METKESYLLSIGCGTEYVHNHGTMFTNGKQCSDCGRFIEKGTLEYFMTSGVSQIWMALHNRRANFHKGNGEDLHLKLIEFMNILINKKQLLLMDKIEAQIFMDETYFLLGRFNISDSEALQSISE